MMYSYSVYVYIYIEWFTFTWLWTLRFHWVNLHIRHLYPEMSPLASPFVISLEHPNFFELQAHLILSSPKSNSNGRITNWSIAIPQVKFQVTSVDDQIPRSHFPSNSPGFSTHFTAPGVPYSVRSASGRRMGYPPTGGTGSNSFSRPGLEKWCGNKWPERLLIMVIIVINSGYNRD